MSRYLIDTNLLIYSLRNHPIWEDVCSKYAIENNNNFISAVSIGELWSLSLRQNWGAKRNENIEKLKQLFIITDINIESIIRRYAEIDAYSQGTLTGKPLGISARNMGKNDLWIAATASALDLTLLTTDKDFEHLNGEFLDLVRM
jgi:tRNA(fMet)-specific endonuclease VapC